MTYRRRYVKLGGGLLLIAYTVVCLTYRQLPYRPWPLYPWNLYSQHSRGSHYYDVIVTSLEPGKKLDQPVFLTDLDRSYHQDWAISPRKTITRYGRDMDAHASPQRMQLDKQLLDNFLIRYPYAEYSLIMTDYNPFEKLRSGKFSTPSDLPYRVIRTFQKESGKGIQ